jgi:hypothetical protein
MNNIQHKLIILLFIALAFPQPGSSQDDITFEPEYEVSRVYPYLSITKENLKEAHSLIDINTRFKSSWVRAYISVEILTTHKGNIRKALSKSDILSQEQKDNMNRADVNTDISVNIQYMPENTLTHNDIKEINFTFSVDPDSEATFHGGKQKLTQYLKEKAIDKIPDGSFKNYDLIAIKFTISEEGEIINAHVYGSEYQTSPTEKIDQLLLETIRNMPCWKPAEYSNGTKVKQEFVFIVGNMENCMINLLNTQRDGRPKNG